MSEVGVFVKTTDDRITRVLQGRIYIACLEQYCRPSVTLLRRKLSEIAPTVFRGIGLVPDHFERLTRREYRPCTGTNNTHTVRKFTHIAITFNHIGIYHAGELFNLIDIGFDDLATHRRTLAIATVEHIRYFCINTEVTLTRHDV